MLYLSNPITINIVTAQSSLLQKHPEPEPMAYLGTYWFVKVQSDPVKCLARRQGIDLLRGSGFGKLLGVTGDREPPALVPPKGCCCQDTFGAQGNPRDKNGGISELLEPESHRKKSLSLVRLSQDGLLLSVC